MIKEIVPVTVDANKPEPTAVITAVSATVLVNFRYATPLVKSSLESVYSDVVPCVVRVLPAAADRIASIVTVPVLDEA